MLTESPIIFGTICKVRQSEADPGSVKRGGRESKFLDAAPENNKNRPKKQKSAEKRGGRDRFGPPPPWIRHCQ